MFVPSEDFVMLFTLTLLVAAQAAEPQRDKALDKAGDIASQPARDVGAVKRDIPVILQNAADAPYELDASADCAVLATDIAALNAELGADYDATKEEGGRTGRYVEAGGKFVVNTIIPFRGLVREVSGAAAADRRLDAAKEAGVARRGFLRGVHTARRCPTTGA
jgi:hypothetical protein